MGRHKRASNSVRSIKKKEKQGRSFDPNAKQFSSERKEGTDLPPKASDQDWLDRPNAASSEARKERQEENKQEKRKMGKTNRTKAKLGTRNRDIAKSAGVVKNVLSRFEGEVQGDSSSPAEPSAIPKLSADDWMPGMFQDLDIKAMPRIKVASLDAAVSGSSKKKKKGDKAEAEEKSDKLLGKQPGESNNAFKRRIDRETRAQLEEQQKRVIGKARVAKRHKRQDFLKNKKASKKERIQDKLHPEEDDLYTKERVAFGDVVERPPELSSGRKRLDKHKKGGKTVIGGTLGAKLLAEKAKAGGSIEFLNQADRVREAYKALKKKRLQDELDEP